MGLIARRFWLNDLQEDLPSTGCTCVIGAVARPSV
jgi:hypothetical protein